MYDHLFSAISEISLECRRILEGLGENNLVKEMGKLSVIYFNFFLQDGLNNQSLEISKK